MRTQDDLIEIRRKAYTLAWTDFRSLVGLTPDERISGPKLLRRYVEMMVDVGESDPVKIAKAAMAMWREYEQILRSKAHLAGHS